MAGRQKRLEQYMEMSVAEFFARHKELAGFSNPARAIHQTIRELVENALDATDTHRILPEITITIRERPDLAAPASNGKTQMRYVITVEDNGIGVPRSVMTEAFGKVLYSSKYVLKQSRGMYGLGVKAAVLYGQATAGEPVAVESSTRESMYSYGVKLYIDVKKNEPRIVEDGQWKKRGRWGGTRVSITLAGDWSRIRWRVIEYVKRTAIIAPYADMVLETPDGNVYYFPRLTRKMPEPPKEAKPHPHGIDLEQMKAIIKQSQAKTLEELLVKEFQSVGVVTARRFLSEVGIDPNLNPKKLLRKEYKDVLTRLVDEMKRYTGFRPPRSNYLSPIGADLIKLGLKRMFAPEWVDAVTRPPRAFEGRPFIVEVGMAWGGAIKPSPEPLLLRYANKIPLLYEEREDVSWKVISRINWKLYQVDFPAPLVILVHVASTKVPYRGVGKESISDVPELESEIKNAVQEVARRLKAYLVRKKREEEAKRRVAAIAKYLPEIARSLAILAKPPEKWSPPTPEEEREILDALIKLTVKHIEVPAEDGKKPEDVVREIISSVEVK
ncbi:DNA topoisomerase VI subunit B [Stetteria hydrogenophila]